MFETLSHLHATLLRAASGLAPKVQVPWRYRLSRPPPTCVSLHTGTPLQRSRSVTSRAMALYGARSTLPMFSSAVLQNGDVESFSHFRLFQPLSAGALMTLPAFLRPVAPFTLLALLCSVLGRFLGRWYFRYQRSSRGAVDRVDEVYLLSSGRQSRGSLLGDLQIQVGLPLAVTLVA